MTPTRRALAGAASALLATPFVRAGGTPQQIHVDAAAGDDRNPGTLRAPLRSLAALGRVPLSPGDSILLRAGRTWRETLLWPRSGEPGRPIRLTRYGDALLASPGRSQWRTSSRPEAEPGAPPCR